MRVKSTAIKELTISRLHKLGTAGEKLAEKTLQKNRFSKIINLNRDIPNFPYADLYAEKEDLRYLISVKIRNKNEAGRNKLNSRYNLGNNCYKAAELLERITGAQSAWLVIQLERTTYNAYFGLLSDLKGNAGIPMTPKAVKKYKCLANALPHDLPYKELKNF